MSPEVSFRVAASRRAARFFGLIACLFVLAWNASARAQSDAGPPDAPVVESADDDDEEPESTPAPTVDAGVRATGSDAAVPASGAVNTAEPASEPQPEAPTIDAPPPFPSGRVVDVVLDPPLVGEDAWARVHIHPGTPLDPVIAREALRSALASGTFSEARVSVRVIPTGLVLVIRGERRVQLQEVAFVGADERANENVRADFGLAAGSWASDTDVARAIDRLRQSYRDAGWNNASVSSRWRATDNPDRRVLIVNILEGPQTTIREVVFEGVPGDVMDTVRGAVEIESGSVAEPQAARRAFDAISAAMHRAGYLNASRPEVSFVPAGPAVVDVVFTVNAGLRYRIDWNGVVWLLPSGLQTALRLEEEHTLDPTTLVALANRVREHYLRRGFIDVRVRAEAGVESRPGQPQTGVLRFTVREGHQTLVRNVEFVGANAIPASELEAILHDALLAALPGGEPGDHVEDSLDYSPGYSPGPPPHATVRLFPERTYVPDVHADAVARMVSHYHDLGFPDATVLVPEVRRVRDDIGRPALDLTFRIHEGPRTIFDEILVEGNHSVASQELISHTELRLGGPLSYATIEAARSAIAAHYREQGFMFASVEPEVERSPDRTNARVRFVVHEGPLVRVGQVIIRGNIRTRRNIIAQRIVFHPGDLVRPTTVRETQRRLGELGVFSGVTIAPIDPNVEAPVKDILIQVVEVRPQFFELRGGYSTGEGVRASLEYGYRNVAGSALTALLRFRVGYLLLVAGDRAFEASLCQAQPCLGRLAGGVNLSLLAPAIPALGPNWRLGGDLGFNRQLERQFSINTVSATASATWRALRQISVNPAVELSVNNLQLNLQGNITDVINSAPETDRFRLQRLLLLPTGTTTLGVGRITAALDLRDQPFNPTRGFYASITTEAVLTLNFVSADTTPVEAGHPRPPEPGNTLRNIVSLSGYIPLFSGIVFAMNLRGGFNITPGRDDPANRKTTFPNRQFFMGGSDSMRGWYQDAFVPQDIVDECRPGGCSGIAGLAQRGADLFVNWRNELRIPFPYFGFPLSIALFADLGNSWRDPSKVATSLSLRGSIGFGLRYITPIGPIALDFGFNVISRYVGIPGIADEPVAAPHFSIGTF